jgi:xanthine dehydrogenase accessory factor
MLKPENEFPDREFPVDAGYLIDCMAQMKGDKQPFAVVTVVHTEDATAAKAGAKAVIRADGTVIGWIGGGCTLRVAKQTAASALADGRSRLIRIAPGGEERIVAGREGFENYCASAGVIELFVEPVLPRAALLIVGASATARALCELGRRMGFAVTAAAAPEDLGTLPEVDYRIGGFDLSEDPRANSAFIVVATQGKHDQKALAAALTTDAPYVGLVASRRKARQLKDDLLAAGMDPQKLAALHSPAGLDIGGQTPEEIALSVLAEIVQERRKAAPEAPRDTDVAPMPAHAGSKQVAAAPQTAIQGAKKTPASAPACCDDE